jgi:hypothetical protein
LTQIKIWRESIWCGYGLSREQPLHLMRVPPHETDGETRKVSQVDYVDILRLCERTV